MLTLSCSKKQMQLPQPLPPSSEKPMTSSQADRLERDMTASNTTARLFFGRRQPSWLTGGPTKQSPEAITCRPPPSGDRPSAPTENEPYGPLELPRIVPTAALPSPALSHDRLMSKPKTKSPQTPDLPTPSTTPCPQSSRDSPTANVQMASTSALSADANTGSEEPDLVITASTNSVSREPTHTDSSPIVSATLDTPKPTISTSTTSAATPPAKESSISVTCGQSNVAIVDLSSATTSPVTETAVIPPTVAPHVVPTVSTSSEIEAAAVTASSPLTANMASVQAAPVSATSDPTVPALPPSVSSPLRRASRANLMHLCVHRYLLSARENLGPGTHARLEILQEAIASGKNMDLHALLLHQIVCLWDLPSGVPKKLTDAVPHFSVGQAAVQEIVTLNKEVDSSFLTRFSSAPFDILGQMPETDSVYIAAVQCLKQLSNNFRRVMQRVWMEERCFIFEEITEELGLCSPVLRRALLKRYLDTKHPQMGRATQEAIWNIIANNEVEFTNRRKNPACHRPAEAAQRDYASQMKQAMRRSAHQTQTPHFSRISHAAHGQTPGPFLPNINTYSLPASPMNSATPSPRINGDPYMHHLAQNAQAARSYILQQQPCPQVPPNTVAQWSPGASAPLMYPTTPYPGLSYAPNLTLHARANPQAQQRIGSATSSHIARLSQTSTLPPRMNSTQFVQGWPNPRVPPESACLARGSVNSLGPAPIPPLQQRNLSGPNIILGSSAESSVLTRPTLSNPVPENQLFFLRPEARGEQVTPPQPNIYALHQSHLESPQIAPRTLSSRMFRYVDCFALAPQQFQQRFMSLSWDFEVPSTIYKRLAKTRRVPETSEFIRDVDLDAVFFRLRVVKRSASSDMSDWIISDVEWPSHTYYSCNKNRLQPRLKLHNGHDMPIDLTDMIKPGTNNIQVVSNARPDQVLDKYALAVEMVAMCDEATIVETCRTKQLLSPALSKERLTRIFTQDDDDDIMCTDESVSIPMSDPISGTPWKIPTRGARCLHHHCFDLETFLLSRPPHNAPHAAPSAVDVWKCPICGADARPQVLMIDGWMLEVRAELIRRRLVDVKIIDVSEKGDWKPRLSMHSNGPEPDLTSPVAHTPTFMDVPLKQSPEIIELDDD